MADGYTWNQERKSNCLTALGDDAFRPRSLSGCAQSEQFASSYPAALLSAKA
jgi:hypothetical protein